jgi:hypothetical protein
VYPDEDWRVNSNKTGSMGLLKNFLDDCSTIEKIIYGVIIIMGIGIAITLAMHPEYEFCLIN